MSGFFEYIQDETAEKLALALAELMETESFDKITTSEILEQSGVSRSTFYRRYRDKYDLLTSNYQQLLDETLGKIAEGLSFKESFFRLYEALKAHPSFFKNALSSDEPNGLKQYIFRKSYETYDQLLKKQGIDTDSTYYRWLLTGYLKGALEVTCIWVEQDMKEPIDFLFHVSYELIPHEIQIHLALAYM